MLRRLYRFFSLGELPPDGRPGGNQGDGLAAQATGPSTMMPIPQAMCITPPSLNSTGRARQQTAPHALPGPLGRGAMRFDSIPDRSQHLLFHDERSRL